MSYSAIDASTLDEFGPMLIKRGYDWISMNKLDTVDTEANKESDNQFVNKALICEAWMEQHDIGVREGHDRLLNSDCPPYEILKGYFDDLEVFMKEHAYRGCPFAQTARAIRGQGEKGIEQKVQEHKSEVRRFFQELCKSATFEPNVLAEALYLIYTGAMSESNDMTAIGPIETGRSAALALFERFLLA